MAVLKVGVNWSEESDPRRAGSEAAGRAQAALGSQAGLALVFCTVGYDEASFVRGVKEAVGDVPIMGATSFSGVLTPGGFLHGEKGAGAVMLLASPEMAFSVGASQIGEQPESAGQEAARKAIARAGESESDPVAAFFMVAPPGAEERLIRGIEQVVGRAPMVGGSAADNTLEGQWKEFANGEVLTDAVVVGLVYSKRPVGVAYDGRFNPTAKHGVITKIRDRRTLVEIDGRRALDVYAEWRGMGLEDLLGGKILAASITNPLGIRDVYGGLWWIRHPMGGNEDGSIVVGSDLAEGTVVTYMEATLEQIAQGASEVVKAALGDLEERAGAVVLAHCGGRALGLGPERMEKVASDIKATLGEVPFVGFCTFGEQGYAKGTANGGGGLMLAAMALPK
ncbi:MAG: FIST signal transduction protein [Chloroflexota bacterium]